MTFDTDVLFFLTELAGTIAFSISGAVTAIKRGLDLFGVVFLGAVTAIGGGMLRDVLSCSTPAVLRKHIYALTSLSGALCYYCLQSMLASASILISTILVIVLRVLASHYRWTLPHVQLCKNRFNHPHLDTKVNENVQEAKKLRF